MSEVGSGEYQWHLCYELGLGLGYRVVEVIYLYVALRYGGLYFFFQADDGIRDDLVTGVQTCALPISTGPGSMAREAALVEAEEDSARRPRILGSAMMAKTTKTATASGTT